MVTAGVEYEYIRIVQLETPPRRKTGIWSIRTNRDDGELGQIRWYGAWRQYVFIPRNDTLYSAGCLRDVVDFIEKRMAERAA